MWLLTIVAILLATGVPWFASGFEVDLATASSGLLALGAIHLAFTLLAAPSRSSGRWRDRALTLLDLAGVAVIGFIWQHVGALQNPLFLSVFALPVIGAIFLSRWHPYLIATVSVLVVLFVALNQAPELRWYASGLSGGDAWLTWLFGDRSAAPPSFAGFYAPSNYLIVMLEVFAILLFACAAAAEYVGIIFERLNSHIVAARTDAHHAQQMWSALVEQLPLPALLIDPHTLRVTASSERASSYLGVGELPLEGRNLFDAVHFSYPDIVNDLIVGADGGAPMVVIRNADQLRITKVRVLHVAHAGRNLALLTIEDATEVFHLKAALDGSDYASLVVDSLGIVLAFNKLAGGLFSGIRVGGEAPQLQTSTDGAARWWEPGLAGRRKIHVQIGSRIYQVTSSAVAIASVADPYGTSTTIVTQTLGRLR
jgi:PAS domain-containing protein